METYIGSKVITVKGDIESGDTDNMITAAESLGVQFDTIEVWLNIPGGNIGSLAIGQ
jgi:hypothetical protein